jgi:hypothetical protein
MKGERFRKRAGACRIERIYLFLEAGLRQLMWLTRRRGKWRGVPAGDRRTGHCPGLKPPTANQGPLRPRIARPMTHDPEFCAKPPRFPARFSGSRCFAQIYGNRSVLRGAGCTILVTIKRRKPVSYGGLPGGSKKRPVSGFAPPAECPIPSSEKSCGYHPSRQRIGCLPRYTIFCPPVLQKPPGVLTQTAGRGIRIRVLNGPRSGNVV